MTIGIFTNKYRDTDLTVTKKLVDTMSKRSIVCYVDEDLSKDFPDLKSYTLSGSVKLDFMITVGGDGTILRIVKYCAKNDIPILGINLGKVGFLTETEVFGIEKLADNLLSGEYGFEERGLLNISVGGNNYYGLNESVVTRSNNNSKMLSLDVSVDNQLMDRFYCDGYIVCTPTGSTAYSLSAGGPILSPKAEAFALTPINAHTLHSKPVVISNDETVKIGFTQSRGEAELIVDGEVKQALKDNDVVSVLKADVKSKFVRFKEYNYYSKLLSKLNIWGNTGEV